MRITLDEKDFENVLLDGEISALREDLQGPILSSEVPKRAELLIRKLPEAIAKILNSIEPRGFHVSQFEITVELSGNPFGIGISGTGSITFSKSSS